MLEQPHQGLSGDVLLDPDPEEGAGLVEQPLVHSPALETLEADPGQHLGPGPVDSAVAVAQEPGLGERVHNPLVENWHKHVTNTHRRQEEEADEELQLEQGTALGPHEGEQLPDLTPEVSPSGPVTG